MAKNQKTFVMVLLVILSVAYLIAVISMWLGYGKITNSSGNVIEATMPIKLIITFGGALVIGLGWFLFNNQKKQDKKLNTPSK